MSEPLPRLNAALEGRYRIERELGEGGTATVYLAYDAKHDRRVAIKVLRPELAAALGSERFLREIQITAQLTHPHVLALYDSGEADGYLYYVMPYVEGESLRDRLRREAQLPIDEALRIAREVARALGYAHSLGIVHRDIKPENVLLSGGYAMVADFGIASALTKAGGERLTATGVAIGTPIYMSPEQASGTEQIDARSDLYSLACVLYEMLVGEPPFTGRSAQAILARHAIDPVPSVRTVRASVPEQVERAVTIALAKVPADRFSTAEEMMEALEHAETAVREPRSARRQRVFAGVAAAAVLLLGGLWVARDWLPGGSGDPEPITPAIAVLPFANLSGDEAQEYLSDGITEELISVLARTPRLLVVSRTSAFEFKGQARNAREIGERLDVQYLVEGTVRPSGGLLSVNVQLTDAESGFTVWSQRYDRAVDQLFTLQDAIAGDVARTLAPEGTGPLSDLGTAITQDPEAYDLYLRGRYQLSRFASEGAGEQAIALFEQAIGRDPQMAEAYVGISEAYSTLSGIWLEPGVALPRVRAAAERALELDASLGRAHAMLGNVRYRLDLDWGAAERSFKRAIELTPNDAIAHHSYGMELVFLGRFDEAQEALDRAVALDPLDVSIEVTAVWPAYFSERYDVAIQRLQEALVAHPDFTGANWLIAWAYALTGEGEEAVAHADRVVEAFGNDPQMAALLASVHALGAREVEARALMDTAAVLSGGRYPSPYLMAIAWAALGEDDLALTELARGLSEREDAMSMMNVDPFLARLRGDPRFQELRRQMGFE